MKKTSAFAIGELVVGTLAGVTVAFQFRQMRKNYRKTTQIMEYEVPDEISDADLEASC